LIFRTTSNELMACLYVSWLAGARSNPATHVETSHQFQRIQVGLTLSDKSNAGYHNLWASAATGSLSFVLNAHFLHQPLNRPLSGEGSTV
jgi:hypothetical protein